MNEHYLVFIKYSDGEWSNTLHFSYPELIEYLENIEGIEFFELVDFRYFFDAVNYKPYRYYQAVSEDISYICVTKVI